MKKIFICAALSLVALSTTSCDKVKDLVSTAKDATAGPAAIDYQFLSKPEEVKKWYDEVVQKAGANAKVMDEVRFLIYRPSSEGMIKREGEKDYLMLSVVYQDSKDKRKVQEVLYLGNVSGWKPAETKEIQVMGIGSENFNLEDELFDFNQVSLESINKVAADAMAKFKDEAKYEYQYIQGLEVTKQGIEVTVKGKIKANAQEKTELYRADLKGNPIN